MPCVDPDLDACPARPRQPGKARVHEMRVYDFDASRATKSLDLHGGPEYSPTARAVDRVRLNPEPFEMRLERRRPLTEKQERQVESVPRQAPGDPLEGRPSDWL
jgi:hypothetical protein